MQLINITLDKIEYPAWVFGLRCGFKAQHNSWIAAFAPDQVAFVANCPYQAIGSLIRSELNTSYNSEKDPFAERKQALLELFPSKHYSYNVGPAHDDETELGRYCVENAERLGILLRRHNRPLEADDLIEKVERVEEHYF